MTLIEQIRDKIARKQYEFSEHSAVIHPAHSSKSSHCTSQTQANGLTLESGQVDMDAHIWKETTVEQKVTYTLMVDGKFFIIENVPARVCLETGERFFSPQTVERLQQTIWEQKPPSRLIETPVYNFAA